MEQPLVAISYPVDDEVREANLDVLGDEAQVVFLQDLQPSERSEMLRPAQALISRRLGRELAPGQLAEARRLRLIQFLSAGVDNVDFAAIPGGIVIGVAHLRRAARRSQRAAVPPERVGGRDGPAGGLPHNLTAWPYRSPQP
jgi:phosphoglycerate dehydrogenase-like enzyme